MNHLFRFIPMRPFPMPRFVLARSLVCFGQLCAGVLTPTGSLNAAREIHTATQLATGKVLLVGGAADRTALSSAELYDLDSETWVITNPMNTARASHTATSLPALPANAAFLPNGALQLPSPILPPLRSASSPAAFRDCPSASGRSLAPLRKHLPANISSPLPKRRITWLGIIACARHRSYETPKK